MVRAASRASRTTSPRCSSWSGPVPPWYAARRAVTALVRTRKVLPIFDGLDELDGTTTPGLTILTNAVITWTTEYYALVNEAGTTFMLNP